MKIKRNLPTTVGMIHATLLEYGAEDFDYSEEGKHYKIKFTAKGEPVQMSVAKTPSDHRWYLNARSVARRLCDHHGLSPVAPYKGPQPFIGLRLSLFKTKDMHSIAISMPMDTDDQRVYYEIDVTPKGFNLVPSSKARGGKPFTKTNASVHQRRNVTARGVFRHLHRFKNEPVRAMELPAVRMPNGTIKVEHIPQVFLEKETASNPAEIFIGTIAEAQNPQKAKEPIEQTENTENVEEKKQEVVVEKPDNIPLETPQARAIPSWQKNVDELEAQMKQENLMCIVIDGKMGILKLTEINAIEMPKPQQEIPTGVPDVQE